jgi:hypothetical protein
VPFDLLKGADRITIATVMLSMSAHALREPGKSESDAQIALRYTSTVAADGREKKMHVQKARNDILELRV